MNKITSVAFYTIIRKEIMRFLRIWTQTLLPALITMSLYFIIFGSLIGKQIKSINGFHYMQFIAPGLIMMAVITNSFGNVAGSFFGSRFQKEIDELLISPTPNSIILIGFIIGGIVRGLCVAFGVTLITLMFTKLQIHHFVIMVASIILCATLFSLAGFTNALYAKRFDDVAILPTFILTPLTYFGGVFFTIDMLPPFWGKLALINPILYMVNAFRYGVLGITDINIYTAFSIIIFCVVSLYSFNIYLLNKGQGIRT